MKGNGERKRFAVTALIINLFTSLTIVFFSPMEVVLMNQHEFYFSFLNAALFQMLAALAAAGIATAVTALLPRKIGRVLAGLSLGCGLAAYIQALFLNGGMVALDGKNMDVSGSTKVFNLVIWAVIIIGAVALLLINKKSVITGVRCAAAALIVMQGAAMIGTAAGNGLAEKGEMLYLTSESQFELSEGNNVIEIILDTTDGTVVREMLAKYPEVYERLAGWIYYPNATSKNSRTFPSVPYMLTGKQYFYDYPAEEYVESAFLESQFLPGMKEAGTDICLYSPDTNYIGTSVTDYVRNAMKYDYGRLDSVAPGQLIKNLMHVGLYKSMPYALKNKFSYKMGIINISSFRDYEKRIHPFRDPDVLFYQDMLDAGGLKTSSDYAQAFRLYHLNGIHPGYAWDQDLNINFTSEKPDALRGSFRVIEKYIDEMKRLGIYDGATIIVTADHGYSNLEGEKLEVQHPYCPLLMVKYPQQDETKPMTINEAPVAHEDLFATIEEALGAQKTGYGSGKALREYAPGEARERLYYYTAYYDHHDGEIVLREYRITGDAEDMRNWELTGRWWDIKYSLFRISDKRFREGQ